MEEQSILVASIVSAISDDADSSTSSSDEEYILLPMIFHDAPGEKRLRIERFMENVIWHYPDDEFRSHFRMRRSTFEEILMLIGPQLKKKNSFRGLPGRNTISPEKQLLVAIWTFATPDSYRSICDRFDVGRATGIRAVRRVVKCLINLRCQFIKWPTVEETETITRSFQAKNGISGIIGAVDGTHIKIPAPKNNPESYINRKQVHSIQLQVVCDHSRKFIHCFVGYPGSVHDQRVFRNSGLQEICASHEKFPDDSHLIGDAAYSLQQHLIVPYKDNGHLTERQKHFNYCLSSTRMVIERSIGLLKGRFRSLLDIMPMKRTDLIPYHIMACCVLHNICLLNNDIIDLPILLNRNNEHNPIRDIVDIYLRRDGIAKRERIADDLLLRED